MTVFIGLLCVLIFGLGTSCVRSGFAPYGPSSDGRPSNGNADDTNPDTRPSDGNADSRPSDGNADDANPDSRSSDANPDDANTDDGPSSCAPGLPPLRWSKGIGSTGKDYGSGVDVDAQGNIYVSGVFSGSVDFGGSTLVSQGKLDAFVVSYTKDGTYRWAKGFGGAEDEDCAFVRVDEKGNVFIVGLYSGSVDFGGGVLTSKKRDAFLASFTSTGAYRWAKRFGGSSTDSASGVTIDRNGNVYVIGSFYGVADFGGGAVTSNGVNDVFIASFTSGGAYRWAKRLGGTNIDYGSGIYVDEKGDVFATGRFFNHTNLDGVDYTSHGKDDIFLASYTSAGNKRWIKTMGGVGADAPFDIAADSQGNVTFTGRFQEKVDFGGGIVTSAGGSDLFLASYARDGSYRWAKGIGGASNDVGRRLAIDDAGHVFLTGFFYGSVDPGGGNITSNGSSDILFVSYTTQGLPRWQTHFGGTGIETGYGLAVDPSGCSVTLAGWTSGSLDFGDGLLANKGSADLFVAHFAHP